MQSLASTIARAVGLIDGAHQAASPLRRTTHSLVNRTRLSAYPYRAHVKSAYRVSPVGGPRLAGLPSPPNGFRAWRAGRLKSSSFRWAWGRGRGINRSCVSSPLAHPCQLPWAPPSRGSLCALRGITAVNRQRQFPLPCPWLTSVSTGEALAGLCGSGRRIGLEEGLEAAPEFHAGARRPPLLVVDLGYFTIAGKKPLDQFTIASESFRIKRTGV
jgi:hypothetical protein